MEEESNVGAPNDNGQGRAGRHQLPPLPYEYDALEPYISQRTMRLHHDIHHRAYVDGLNRAEEELAQARRERRWDAVNDLLRRLAFNGSGHFLHTIFWHNMHPNGGGRPSDDELMRQIQQDFGSFEAFRDQFTAAANGLQGNGWVLLVWQPQAQKLEILHTEQHHYSTQWTTVPILVLDLWEHAYYLQYQARRPDYVESWWNVVNWPDVAQRLRQARCETASDDEAARLGEYVRWEEDGDGSDWQDGSDGTEVDDETPGEAGGGAGDEGSSDGDSSSSGTASGETNFDQDGTHPGAGDGTQPPHPHIPDEDEYVVSDDVAAVQTVYGSRSSIRRALWASAVKGGTTTRTGTVRPTPGRRLFP